ncbi:MAG: CDP-alcohol phosphatidyltransferase family protein [Bdellovibrionota bacterium]
MTESESQKKIDRDSTVLRSELRNWWVLNVIKPIEDFLIRKNIHPNQITLLALGTSVLGAFLLANGRLLFAGWIILLTGSLDILDGRVARATNQSSKKGEFLDSVMDRVQDLMLFAGLAFYYRFHPWILGSVLLALVGSVMVSYVRAKAALYDIDLSKVGTLQRPERFFLLGFGCLLGAMFQIALWPFYGRDHQPPAHLLIGALIILAVTSAWSAWERIMFSLRSLD